MSDSDVGSHNGAGNVVWAQVGSLEAFSNSFGFLQFVRVFHLREWHSGCNWSIRIVFRFLGQDIFLFLLLFWLVSIFSFLIVILRKWGNIRFSEQTIVNLKEKQLSGSKNLGYSEDIP